MPAIVYPISSEEYTDLKGSRCPYCGSIHSETLGPVDVGDGGTGYQHMVCRKCHKKWYDQYKLVGFIHSK